MWAVKNTTPFAAQGYFVRDRDGFEHWTVAIRARFRINHDDYPKISEPLPVRLAPVYTDDSAAELLSESDIAPFRPKTDIILHGEVDTAEPGKARRDVSLRLGRLEKTLRIYGPRRATRQDGQWQVEWAAFTPLRLSWRHALGGPDVVPPDAVPLLLPANPIGVGWSPRLSQIPDGAAFNLPRLEHPGHLLHPERALPAPAGFGPIMPAWQPRLKHAGTYDTAWQEERAPASPADFSEAFHQSAPEDQVYPAELRGGEPVELAGFSSGHLAFRLPQIIFTARTRISRSTIDSRFRLILVEANASAQTLDMVWNMSVPCPGGDHLVEQSVVFMQQMSGVLR